MTYTLTPAELAHIQRTVAEAPPMSEALVAKVAALLQPSYDRMMATQDAATPASL